MNINQIMKQAQAMQKKLAEAQEKIAQTEVTGQSGGGMVQITMSGKGDAKKLKLDPSIIDPTDPEMLEDLIVAAINDAKKKAEDESSGLMDQVTGGMNIPGLKF